MTLRVVFAGTPAFAVPPLEALLGAHHVVGVLTQPDRPAGRGRSLTASPVKQVALARGLPVLQPERLRGDPVALESTLAQLRHWAPDVIVVVAYGLILPQAVLELPRLGCLNIHASLLPRWRGAAPIQRAILAGDATSGISIMQMDAGLDTGAVLLTGAVPIGGQTTADDLHDVLAQLGARLILEALAACEAGGAQPVPQPATGVTYAEKLSKAESLLDWSLPAAQLDRRIRAFHPWPGAETRMAGEPLKLLRSRLPADPRAPADNPARAGTVLGLEGRCAGRAVRRGRAAGAAAAACGSQAGGRARLRQRGCRGGRHADGVGGERAGPRGLRTGRPGDGLRGIRAASGAGGGRDSRRSTVGSRTATAGARRGARDPGRQPAQFPAIGAGGGCAAATGPEDAFAGARAAGRGRAPAGAFAR